MDGRNSELFIYFQQMVYKGLSAIRKYAPEIKLILDVMRHESDLTCFTKFDMKLLMDRMAIDQEEPEVFALAQKLVAESAENNRCALYDNLQKLTNGIMP
jgi:phosphatidylinositol 4-kinase